MILVSPRWLATPEAAAAVVATAVAAATVAEVASLPPTPRLSVVLAGKRGSTWLPLRWAIELFPLFHFLVMHMLHRIDISISNRFVLDIALPGFRRQGALRE